MTAVDRMMMPPLVDGRVLEEETNTLAVVGTPAGLGKLCAVRAVSFPSVGSYLRSD